MTIIKAHAIIKSKNLEQNSLSQKNKRINKMIDGLWVIEFSSSLNLSGTGILVLSKNRLFGGDTGYYYSGNYDIDNNILTAKIIATRFDTNSISVFGSKDQFTLEIKGKLSDSEFSARGNLQDNPNLTIYVKGKKKENM